MIKDKTNQCNCYEPTQRPYVMLILHVHLVVCLNALEGKISFGSEYILLIFIST